MNSVPGNSDRRTIKVKDFLDDYRSAIGDLDLMTKYGLSIRGLDKFVQLLVDRRILSSDEVALRNEKLLCTVAEQIAFIDTEKPAPETDQSAFMCPSCLITWPEMFDVCPNCGVLVQEYMAAQSKLSETAADQVTLCLDTDPTPQMEDSPDQGVSPVDAAGDSLDPGDSPIHATSDTSKDKAPIEIPLFEKLADTPPETSKPAVKDLARAKPPFVWSEKVRPPKSVAELIDEDIIPGTPISAHDGPQRRPAGRKAWCTSCATPLEPDVRLVYDEDAGRFSLKLSGICFLLGFLGAFSLTLFNGYSFARLLMVYGTGMMLMAATVFMTVGSLMLLAKEKVFRCSNCDRVYPRA